MQNKSKIIMILMSCGMFAVFNANAAESATVPTNHVASATSNSLSINSTALQRADNDYNQLNELKRQAAIKEQQAKLVPPIAQGGSTGSSNNTYFMSGPKVSDILVTNVVVNKNNSFANLKFPSGDTLLVYLGDKVDGYTVRSISLSGVFIAKCKKKCSKPILLKRTYNAPLDVPMSSSTGSNSMVNNSNSSDMNQVPPIMRAP